MSHETASPRNWRRKLAPAATALVLSTSLAGYETAAASQSEAAAEIQPTKETIKQRTDRQLKLVHDQISSMLADKKKSVFKGYTEKVTLNGRKQTRRVISFGDTIPGTKGKTYSYVIEYLDKPAEKLPSGLVVILGGSTPRPNPGVDFDNATTLVRNPNDPDNYLLVHFFNDRQRGKLTQSYYESNPPKNAFWQNNGPLEQISRTRMGEVFEDFITDAAGLLGYIKEQENQASGPKA